MTRDVIIEALMRLDDTMRLLRKECPWDAAQNERTIVPHTVEEAYELADAIYSGDDSKFVDELGDVLVSVVFLSLLLEERNAGSLAVVADEVREKLVRRHPHVFKDVEAETPAEVADTWEQIKREERAGEEELFGGVAENLPGPNYARKIQRWAGAHGHEVQGDPFSVVSERLAQLQANTFESDEARFQALGDLLFSVVSIGRKLDTDPELALRTAANRFRKQVEDDYRADNP